MKPPLKEPEPLPRKTILLVTLLLAACAPRVQTLTEGTVRPASEPMDGEGAFRSVDGLALKLRAWPAERAPKAVIVALHGFNDYSNAFAASAAWWAARGITTYAYDQRGFGSDPRAGVWPGVAPLVGDLCTAIGAVRANHPATPVYALGASMGGAVIMAAAAGPSCEELTALAGLILVAPAVRGRASLNPLTRTALWVGAHLAPWATVTGRGLGIIPSDNVEMLRALSADPLVIKETRVDAIFGMVNLMDAALAAAPRIRMPTLLLYGANDEIIPPRPTRMMVERWSGPIRTAVYPAGYHMLLRDLGAEAVWDDVVAWTIDGEAALPSGHEIDDAASFASRIAAR